MADVLLGHHDPSGRLPFTWYQDDQDLPPITNYSIRPHGKNPGRTYMYYRGPVSYPFGYGLSYTKFAFSHLQIDNAHPDANGTIHVKAQVTNTGKTAGNEIAELYVSTPGAPSSLQRPIKRLEGFQKVFLKPGQSKTVSFTISVPSLAFYNERQNRWVVDDGAYGIQIGDSSAEAGIQQQRLIRVSGTLTPVLKVITAKPTLPSDAKRDIHDRLLFPRDSQVLPNLTASMSDDVLYGYITKGQSKPLPKGMKISYRSDHPGAVSVSRTGKIHTTARRGVATITATVTYQGVTHTGQFIIYNTGKSTVGS